MAESNTEICNLALKHAGITKEISDVETERSAEALSCRRFYAVVLDIILRSLSWPFASTVEPLSLVSENPTDEYAYAYRYPANCVRMTRILSGRRNDYRTSRVTYKLGRDSVGRLIYTDQPNAQIEYTFRETNVLIYPSDFVMAFSMLLGAYVVPGLSGGDPNNIRDKILALYEKEMSIARASAANEEEPDDTPDGEFIRGRN